MKNEYIYFKLQPKLPKIIMRLTPREWRVTVATLS